MSTVAEVVDRVFRDWLFGADDQPVVVTLTSDVDAVTGTLPYDDTALAPDEEDLLAPGVLVEVGTELCRITDVNATGNQMTVTRGVNGTAATSHSAGDEIRVAPLFTRVAVVEAVKDNVVALYPSLWHIATTELTSGPSYVEVPAEVVTPKGLIWQNGTRYQNAPLPELLTNFPPSPTGTAIQLYSVPIDHTIFFTYAARFARPSSEASELSDLGVEREWERIVEVGAAAQVVASRPQDRLSAEYITEQLEREALPPGSVMDVRNGLLTVRNILIDEAHRRLNADQDTPVTYTAGWAVRR